MQDPALRRLPGPGPRHVVVMGVSGTGKTTVGLQLAEHFGWEFVEGDSFHPSANVEKMSAGIALDDADREPWLETLSLALARHHANGSPSVLTCSALKRHYRDVLRARLPDAAPVFFVHLTAPYDVLAGCSDRGRRDAIGRRGSCSGAGRPVTASAWPRSEGRARRPRRRRRSR